ncbi:MAG: efflux RND transporter periplasmic adaptor subunit [Rickettsia endosymbiont of Pentastiridius leporinus]
MYTKLIALFILLASFSASASKKEEEKIIGVKTAKAEIAKLYEIFNIVGQCQNDNSRDYYANVSGIVEQVSAKQGQIVKEGEILLAIDKDIAETTKSRAEAMLNTKQEEYNRKEALFAKRFVSSEEHKRAKSEFEEARFNYSRALKTYSDMIITAPYAGKIGVIKPMVGDEVKIGDYLFSITGKDATQTILIELPESLSHKVSTDTEVLIKGKIKSKIFAVSHYLSNNGTITAKISLPPGTNILHNSYVDVSLILNPHENLAVPEGSIQRNNQGNFIYKVESDTVKQIYVKIGLRTNGLIEITSNDIHKGDLVVTEGMTKINYGAKVRILE